MSRLPVALGCAVLLLATGAYYAHVAMIAQQGWRWCLEAPVARDGSLLVFPLWTVSGIQGPDRYTISKVVKDIPVAGSTAELHVGATVSVMGDFTWNGGAPYTRETRREVHVLRAWKEALGVLSVMIMGLALPFGFRLREYITERTWPT